MNSDKEDTITVPLNLETLITVEGVLRELQLRRKIKHQPIKFNHAIQVVQEMTYALLQSRAKSTRADPTVTPTERPNPSDVVRLDDGVEPEADTIDD